VSGRDFTAAKKYRDVAATSRAAIVIVIVIVINDLASLDPWRPRGIEIRCHAQTVGGSEPCIVIHPDRVISWGLDDTDPST
jgi:pyridoxamine 5'-phosphate oxidase family protein